MQDMWYIIKTSELTLTSNVKLQHSSCFRFHQQLKLRFLSLRQNHVRVICLHQYALNGPKLSSLWNCFPSKYSIHCSKYMNQRRSLSYHQTKFHKQQYNMWIIHMFKYKYSHMKECYIMANTVNYIVAKANNVENGRIKRDLIEKIIFRSLIQSKFQAG